MSVRVILNADDFGLSEGVSRGIVELLEAGAVDSTTVMICAGEEVPTRVRRYSSQLAGRAGVHLQLSSGVPLSSRAEVPTLCDRSGRFVGPGDLARVSLGEVEREWRRQIEAVAEAIGASPTHLDSHHGVHRHPLLAPVYGLLAAELNLPVRERGVCEPQPGGSDVAVDAWTGTGHGTTDLLASLTQARAGLAADGVIDLICHPGHADELLSVRSSWREVREVEMLALTEISASGELEAAGFERVSYAGLR